MQLWAVFAIIVACVTAFIVLLCCLKGPVTVSLRKTIIYKIDRQDHTPDTAEVHNLADLIGASGDAVKEQKEG